MPSNPETTLKTRAIEEIGAAIKNPTGHMTTTQYNEAVDLWNAGRNTSEIAAALGMSVYDMHPITRAAARVVMRMTEDGPVQLEKINV